MAWVANASTFDPENGKNGGPDTVSGTPWNEVVTRPLGDQTGVSNVRIASLAVSLKFSTSAD